jgi:hypothetical protein
MPNSAKSRVSEYGFGTRGLVQTETSRLFGRSRITCNVNVSDTFTVPDKTLPTLVVLVTFPLLNRKIDPLVGRMPAAPVPLPSQNVWIVPSMIATAVAGARTKRDVTRLLVVL